MKKTITLTESDLHNIIKESVNIILNEIQGDSTNVRNRTRRFIHRLQRGDYDTELSKGKINFIFDIPYIDTDALYNAAIERINGSKKVYTNPWNEPFDPDMGWH